MSRFGKPEKTTEHQDFQERLSAYLDGELTAQERDAVERHLSTCQACQWDLETLSQTVQWTRELPAVPVPHVFTIQVPATAQRATQRRWSLVPTLQAATALVAFLLFFTVAGDLMLGSFRLAGAPEPAAMQQQPASAVDATQGLELARQASPELMQPAEAVVVETVVVEAEVEVEATVQVQAEKAVTASMPAAPMPTQAPAPAPGEEAGPLAAEAEEGEAVVAEVAPSEPGMEGDSGESRADELGLLTVPSPTVEIEVPLAAGGEAVSTTLTAVAPTLAQPTALAAAAEEGLGAADEVPARALRQPITPWLRLTEYALGVLLLVLAATTLAAMVQRRRSR